MPNYLNQPSVDTNPRFYWTIGRTAGQRSEVEVGLCLLSDQFKRGFREFREDLY